MKKINGGYVILLVLFLTIIGCNKTYKQAATTTNSVAIDTMMQKAPYLIYMGVNTEYLLLWQLKNSQSTTLQWGMDTTYSSVTIKTAEYGDDHQHQYKFTDLMPGKRYYYKVVVGQEQYKGDFFAAPEKEAKAVKFVVYGDTRTVPESHEKVAAAIEKLYRSDSGYQTIIPFSGDAVYRGDQEKYWTNDYFNPKFKNMQKLRGSVGYQVAIGNHEDEGILYKKYFPYNYVKNHYWAFDYGPVRFIILDQYSTSYKAGSEQLKWFENELKTSNKEWKIVIMHKVGYSVGHHGVDKKTIKYILPLCEKYGVKLMFGGHNHLYARAVVNGVYCITTGGGGASISDEVDTNTPYIEKVALKHHFCKVNIEDKKLYFEAVDDSSKTLDKFVISLDEK
jgi:hypothetical protein